MITKSTLFSIFLIFLTASILLILFALPIDHIVTGRITDWIGNDNGFGIKLDGQIFWFDYYGQYYGCDNKTYTDLIGENVIIEYRSTFFNPTGGGLGYAHLIYFNITEYKPT